MTDLCRALEQIPSLSPALEGGDQETGNTGPTEDMKRFEREESEIVRSLAPNAAKTKVVVVCDAEIVAHRQGRTTV